MTKYPRCNNVSGSAPITCEYCAANNANVFSNTNHAIIRAKSFDEVTAVCTFWRRNGTGYVHIVIALESEVYIFSENSPLGELGP